MEGQADKEGIVHGFQKQMKGPMDRHLGAYQPVA